MDVSFTNVLEGARQYFQGLPATSGSAEGPSYPSANQQQLHQSNPTQNHDRIQPASVPYWPPQQEPQARPPPRERTPVEAQRPPSHHSDQQRPSTHNQIGIHAQETARVPTNYHPGFQDQSATQTFQFQRPHSRELPNNTSHHQQYQSHILPNPSYHPQPPSPQQPRTQTRSEPQSPSPSYHQLQPPQSISQQYPPHSYNNYQQRTTHYPPHSTNKPVVSTASSYSKLPQSQSHPHPHENSYIKSYPNYSQNNVNTNHYSIEKPVSFHQDVKQSAVNQSVPQVQPTSQPHRTTHNLPPIAALSSINYGRSNRETIRLNSQRPRASVPVVTSANSIHHRSVPTTGVPPNRPPEQYPASTVDFRNGPHSAENRQHQHKPPTSQNYSSAPTTTTASYTYPISTPSTNSTCYPTQPHPSSNSHSNYHISPKVYQTDSNPPASMPHATHVAPTAGHTAPGNNSLNLTVGQQAAINKHKRESPLDLSVKTVRTPADSTLEDADEVQRNNKYYNNRLLPQTSSQPPSHGYPTYEVYPNQFSRNLTARNTQIPSDGAPKIDFLPNFNVPSLNHSQPNLFKDTRKLPQPSYDKAHNLRLAYENKVNAHQPYHPSNPQRVIQQQNNVNSVINVSNVSVPKKTVEGLPRMEFPPPGHGHKTSAMYPINNPHDVNKKRPADTAPPMIPSKMPKMDTWKHMDAIDQQIEQKFSSYVKSRQQQEQKQPTSSKQLVNGNYISASQDKLKENYSNVGHRNQYTNLPQQQQPNLTSTSQYQPPPSIHNQTYVPSATPHQYPNYSAYPGHHHALYNNQPPTIPKINSSLNSASTNRANLGGAADKRVLHLLRNSLEIKGAKEAQRKLEQDQNKQHDSVPFVPPPRQMQPQQPTTDVTAPLQPKPGIVGRHNVSPFTAASLLERNSNTPPTYKFHLPKAMDSVRLEDEMKTIIQNEKQEAMITNNANTDLDGLAAFLAARIRTKAELKQVGSTQNASNNNTANNIITARENEVTEVINNKVQDCSSTLNSINGPSASPPKPTKDRLLGFSPRRRLFSRVEEEAANQAIEGTKIKNSNVPPRDKSGLRSSSETSVFDFPDSDSDTEKQSLEDMRRDRKNVKPTGVDIKVEIKEEINSRASSPVDSTFDLACDNFLEQLKLGVGKKKGRRKKMESDVLANLEETVVKEKPAEVKVKIEPETFYENERDTLLSNIKIKTEKEDIEDEKLELEFSTPCNTTEKGNANKIRVNEDSDSDAPLATVKKIATVIVSDNEEEVVKRDKSGAKIKIETSSESSSDSESESLQRTSEKFKSKKLKNSNPDGQKVTINIYAKPGKKPVFGDGTDFHPGWEEEVCNYKKSLRMPATLIHVTRPPNCQRLSTSLPDLDPCPMSPAPSSVIDLSDYSKHKIKIKTEIDSDMDSNCSFNFSFGKPNYDSEEGGSVKSLNIDSRDNKRKDSGILDKLLERYGGRKRRKLKRKDEQLGPKIIPKAENPVELLPTPSLEVNSSNVKSQPVIKSESVLLGFRKKTLDNFKDAFINTPKNIVGVNAQFTTVVLKSRTRTETRVLKQKATIREVFGDDRPASAPPVTCVDDLKQKDSECEDIKPSLEELLKSANEKENVDKRKENKDSLKMGTRGRKSENLLKTLVSKAIKVEYSDDMDLSKDGDSKSEIDTKSETPSLDGDDTSITGKKRCKLRNMRRKFSSGFDYIRKKKKQIKKEAVDNNDATAQKPRGRGRAVVVRDIESIEDIQKEIKMWVLNKGIGETHLHRSARLGYADITAYCLEKMDCPPSPKDNAGYTPLHEACSRGHLDIARLLLMYGANVSESALGGIRPLHEAVENGFVEIVRLLLSYGADPLLATYTGLTPLALAGDDITATLLQHYIDDIQGKSSIPMEFRGPASCFDLDETGYDPLGDIPEADSPINLNEEDIEFEVSETPLPNLYCFKDEPLTERWLLLQDLSTFLKIKSRDALLKQINPSSSTSASNKQLIREMKMSEFLEQAHCCQFLNANEKINTRASKIAMVKYSDKIRQLLNVEKIVITER